MSPQHSNTRGKKYTTCCGYHVRTVATYLAIYIIVIEAISLIETLKDYDKHVLNYLDVHGIITNITLILTNLFVIYADKIEQPWAYIPLLFAEALYVLLCSLQILVMFTCNSFIYKEILIKRIILIILFLVIYPLFCVYHWSVVYRARKYMVEEVLPRNAIRDLEKNEESI